MISTLAEPFHLSGTAAVEAFSEFIITVPLGTGKTTTVLQVVDAIVSGGRAVALFFPLGDWCTQSESLLVSLVRRPAFQGIREQHLVLLAHRGDWFSRWTAGTSWIPTQEGGQPLKLGSYSAISRNSG